MGTLHTGCPGGNVPDFGRMFLTLKYTDITNVLYLLYCALCTCCTVCIDVLSLDAGLLARSQYSEGPATGHLDTGFT